MSRELRPPSSAPTPFLVGLVGALQGRQISLGSRRVVVGRDATRCDVALDHALISRQHAALETDEHGRVTVIDLGSTQGTYVNGTRVDRQELQDGDSVGLGREGLIAFRFRAVEKIRRHELTSSPALENFSVQEVRARLRSAGESVARKATPPAVTVPPQRDGIAASGRLAAPLRVGRAQDNDIVLESPGVSRYHATIRYETDGSPLIADAGSTNGTFVNGEPVRGTRAVTPQDLVFLGGFLLRIIGRNVTKYDLGSSRVIASGISKDFGASKVLQDISFAILPREFIGLMGPSGCGKSTLMDALNGLRPASRGTVFVNDLDLYRNFDAIRRSIGYVPQRDILHDALSVERTLHYAARLRLPENTADQEMSHIIDEVISTVGLQEHRGTAFQQLSGGQQKRVSLALELLTKPSFLFLDEPTSPLDPETSENLMLLFRSLADEGRIVVMVTHKFEKFEQMHQIALLTKGGRLAYFGPPREALRYFGCDEPGEIYRQVGAKDPEDVGRAFRASPEYQANVVSRLTESQQAINAAQSVGVTRTRESRVPGTRAGFRQWAILTHRYFEIKLKDRRNTALLVAQAPIIAVILSVISGKTVNDATTLFIAAIIAIWFGANNAIREIVAEMPVYRRERLVNLKIASYVLSKFAVLGLIAIVQCAFLLTTLVVLERLRWDDFAGLLITTSLTAFGGIGLGLLFSAFVNSTEKAMSILPLILIPQLLLSGFLKPVDDVYFHHDTGKPATAGQYRAFENTKNQPALTLRTPALPDVIVKVDGLGDAAYASDLMIARWSVDALVHGVSRRDSVARDLLATHMSVSAYARVQAGAPASEIDSAYEQRVLLDWIVLASAAALCLLLAGWALRSKDSL
jgi:ABC-type multidrug transport system ATPase subunit/pSer/pThr/pTyr-binding forkhead associated (FHA) protein